MQKLIRIITAIIISCALAGCATIPVAPCNQGEIPHAASMQGCNERQP